jgi:hypothetical protein
MSCSATSVVWSSVEDTLTLVFLAKAGVAMPITAMAERINVFNFIILGNF